MATSNRHKGERQNQNGRPSRSSRSAEWARERRLVLDAAREMHRQGLVAGTSGNVSSRCGENLIAITVSGKAYEHLTQDDVVVVDFDGEPVVGDGVPSTELLMHAAIYRARADVQAVMHTHSVHASALAVAGVSLPPIVDEMVIKLGDGVHVSKYAFPSSEELGASVVVALGERSAALVKNHGLVGVGKDPEAALNVCSFVERLAHIYTLARSVGEPQALPPEIVASELELYRMRQSMEELEQTEGIE